MSSPVTPRDPEPPFADQEPIWPGPVRCAARPASAALADLLDSAPESAGPHASAPVTQVAERPSSDLPDLAEFEVTSPSDAASSSGDTGQRRPRRSTTDPGLICALLLLRRAIRTAGPGLRTSQLVILEVASTAWMDPVAAAWQQLLAADTAPTALGDLHKANSPRCRGTRPRWILCTPTRKRGEDPEKSDEAIALAVSEGVPVLGISTNPDRLLPRTLVQAADLRLSLPLCDAAALRRTARMLTGRSPTRVLALDDGGLSPDLLRLARRPGQTADGWLTRLAELVRRGAAPPAAIALTDLAGMDEVVSWGTRLARDIADYRSGRIGWAAVDRGALLAGPPGVGKTTAARAIAASCGIPLVATSYAEWQAHREGHLGDVTRAIRSAFERARTLAPCLLFIDEIDSLQARGRGARFDDWWTATINCLLEELDGLEQRDGVVVLAATNYPHAVDPALRRAGRLDRVIHIPPPDAPALARILRFHLGADLPDADLARVAERLAAQGGTGADAEQLVRGARQRARHADRVLQPEDLLAGTPELRAIPPAQRWRAAVHEAGHAVAAWVLNTGSLVRVSIRERGNAGGWTRLQREPEALTRERVDALLTMLLAGRAAEEILLGAPSAGSGGDPDSDLAKASWLARGAVASLGLGRGGSALLWRGPMADTMASAPLADDVEAEAAAMLTDAYAAAIALVQANQPAVTALATRLRDRGDLDGAEAEAVIRDAQTLRSPAADSPSNVPEIR